MTEQHQPTTLSFYSLAMYSWRAATATFQSNKGHQVEIKLTDEEIETIKGIAKSAEARALREIPEMLAEVIAERRVQEILSKREADAAALLTDGTAAPKPADPFSDEIPF